MVEHICPLCSGTGKYDVSMVWELSTQMRMIFDALSARPHTSRELQDIVYRDHPDGGPENVFTSFNNQVSRMNQRLAKHGLRVQASKGRGENLYRIERIAL